MNRAMNTAVKTTKMWAALLIVAAVVWAGMHFLGPDLVARVSYAVESGKVEAARDNLERLSRFDRMSALFREVSKTVKPAVVEIHVVKKATMHLNDLLQRRFGDNDFPMPRRQRRFPRPRMGLGSGVIIDAKNGYILTNEHVISGADKVTIVLADRRIFDVVWTRRDPASDLAVVKIKPNRLIEAPLGNSDDVEVGDWVLAVGAPQKLPQTVTAGIISAKGRMNGDPSKYQNYLQTDAAINYGNSGGPLVNMKGEVIGINTAIVSPSLSGVNSGIGLAIPSNMARRIMDQLITTGKVTRGYLGVLIQDVDEKLAQSFNLPGTKGALVSLVAKGSPAEKGGIKVEDFIVSIDGKAVTGTRGLRLMVADIPPGKSVAVKVYREGKPITVEVKLEVQPEDMVRAFRGQTAGEATLEDYGLKVTTLTPELIQKAGFKKDTTGVLIVEVAGGSDAAERGLRQDMVITHVGRKAVNTAEELSQEVAEAAKGAGGGVRLRVVNPQGGARFVFLTPSE